MTQVDPGTHLRDTQDAFDSVAADYDGPRGNNSLIQDMRDEMWCWLDRTFARGSRLIDLGCGTGLDAVRMGRLGHRITATDWSPQMIARTIERAHQESVTDRVEAMAVGAHELQRLEGEGSFDGAYVFAPPPYLTWVRDRHPRLYERLWRIDRRTASWPFLRSIGDHFLIVLRQR